MSTALVAIAAVVVVEYDVEAVSDPKLDDILPELPALAFAKKSKL